MLNNYKVLFHSSIVLNDVVYIDPYKIKSATHNAKFVFITHSHYDHFSTDDVKKVMNSNTNFLVPHEVKVGLLKMGVPDYKITVVVPNNTYFIEGLAFSTYSAYNLDNKFHPKMNNWLSYVIDFNGDKVGIIGDSDLTDDNKNINCNTLFIPIGGTYTMDAVDAANLTNIIMPKKVIPIHYNAIVGTNVDAETFKQNVKPEIEVELVL